MEQPDLKTPSMQFKISAKELTKRNRNILWGAAFSVLLAGVVAAANRRYPATYNDTFLWSVIGFVVLANLVNFVRHLRYLKRARMHRLQVDDGLVRFYTGDEMSELEPADIAALTVYRTKGEIGHLQLRLKNNRGVRIEGYEDMDGLKEALAGLLPAAHVQD